MRSAFVTLTMRRVAEIIRKAKMSSYITPEIILQVPGYYVWIARDICPDFFDELNRLPLVSRPPICIRGKEYRQRRDIQFFSDEVSSYRYSGIEAKAAPMVSHPLLGHITAYLNRHLETNFNGVLVNRYRDGEDYISSHSDAEENLGTDRHGQHVVAGMSFGSSREIQFHDAKTGTHLLTYTLPGRSLYVMVGDQRLVKHGIPRCKNRGPRISLTWRRHC